jgi:hypothetical protein
MKTSINLPDPLLDEARKVARREGTTERALVEQGLRQVLEQKRLDSAFRLRDASFAGDGLHPELEGASWERRREMVHEGRGG